MTDAIGFNMGGETTESFVADDTDSGKWTPEDRTEAGTAKEFLGLLKNTYDEKELKNLNGMLSTKVDDEGHGLGDSRLFIKAVARAARQFDEVLRKRIGGSREDGQAQIHYNMPLTGHNERVAIQREAQAILDRELMAARSEFIRRSGRSLPGWWR